MFVIYVSLNYQQLPIDIREQLVFAKEDLDKANQLLNSEKSILENVILSTCNRTEIYAVVDQIHTGRYYVKRFLANWFHVTIDQMTEWSVIGTKEDAVAHVMRVATGLESLIVGEPQILGQLKNAFFTAQKDGTTGVILDHLFQETIAFSKRMHTEYRVSELAKTSGQTGLHQIKVQLQNLTGKQLVIAGMGEVGTHVLKNASTMGFDQITVLNRTDAKATQLAADYDATVQADAWSDLPTAVADADAVILSTAAKEPVLSAQALQTTRPKLKVMIDLGVPRNVDAQTLPADVTYYDIDHLTEIIAQNQQTKDAMMDAIADNVPAAVNDFYVWQRQLHVVPVVRELRESALSVEKNVYDSLLRKLPELDAHQRKVISKHMKSIINQMIKGPIKEIKELSVRDDAALDLAFFCQIFGLATDDVLQEDSHHEK